MQMSRRGFLISSGAALAAKTVPRVASKAGGRRILTLIYDKALGAMRAVERVVHCRVTRVCDDAPPAIPRMPPAGVFLAR